MLLLVAGRQDAIIYKLDRGEITKLDGFKIPRPKYSDNEGHFKARSSGVTLRSGGTRELRDEDVIRDFVREVKHRTKKHQKTVDFSELYIFAPDKTKNRIQKAIPVLWRQRTKRIIPGNYYNHRPLELLRKVKASRV